MFKTSANPKSSELGRFPRTMQEAFKYHPDYACAIEQPTTNIRCLRQLLSAFPKVIWGTAVVAGAILFIGVYWMQGYTS